MTDALLDRRRAQVGASIRSWPTGDRAVTASGDGWWLVLSGAPSPDGNIGLVFSDDPDVLRGAVSQVEQAGHPVLLMTAGIAPEQLRTAPWQEVGTMPLMAVDLDDTPTAHDPRVRRAVEPDRAAVVDLLVAAYDMQPEIAAFVVDPVLRGNAQIAFWLLEDDAAGAVSTVMTARHEEVVTIWCMATRPEQMRRGYGRVLLAHVLAAAAEDGATVGLLGATPTGESLYRATGWTTLEEWRIHLSTPSVQFAH